VDRNGEVRAEPTASVRTALAPLLAHPETTAIMTDFDGTLSSIVDDPAAARPLPGAPEVLARLADTFKTVAVVSGRSAAFLAEHLVHSGTLTSERSVPGRPARGLQLVGLYGLEWSAGDGVITRDPEAERWRAAIDQTADRLRSHAPPGAVVELKGLAVTLHWRQAPDAEGWAVGAGTGEAERTGLRLHPGRMSLELRPPLAIDKGTVVRRLASGCAAACYLGDDLGDLPAFAALSALAGEEGMATVAIAVVDDESDPEVEAAADVTVNGPQEGLGVLGWLATAGASRGQA
jgi:trehalose 6-phosphate phosphatase